MFSILSNVFNQLNDLSPLWTFVLFIESMEWFPPDWNNYSSLNLIWNKFNPDFVVFIKKTITYSLVNKDRIYLTETNPNMRNLWFSSRLFPRLSKVLKITFQTKFLLFIHLIIYSLWIVCKVKHTFSNEWSYLNRHILIQTISPVSHLF